MCKNYDKIKIIKHKTCLIKIPYKNFQLKIEMKNLFIIVINIYDI